MPDPQGGIGDTSASGTPGILPLGTQIQTPSGPVALNPATGPYGATTSIQVAPMGVSVQSQAGYDGTGVTFSDAAFTAAKAQLPNGAGIVVFPPGSPKFASPLTLAVAGVSIQGAGRGNTVLNYASTTADLIVVSANSCEVRGLNLVRAGGTAVSGSGINLSSGVDAIMDDLIVQGFFYNISTLNASAWSLDHAYIINAVQYEIYVRDSNAPDTGDSSIGSGVLLDTGVATPSAIRWESAGGLRLSNPKILHHGYGIDLQVVDGTSTGDLTIAGMSIESQTTAGLRLGRLGTTGNFARVAIAGIQMVEPASVDGIIVQAGISSLSIGGASDIVGPASRYGVDFQANTNYALVDGVLFEGWGTGIRLSNTSSAVSIGANGYRGVAIPVEDNVPPTNRQGTILHDYRNLVLVTSAVTYNNYFQIDMLTYRGFKFELTIEGIVQGVAGFGRHIVGVVSRAAGNCAVTTISDSASGAVIDVQFDVTTTPGSVLVGVRRNAGGGGTEVDAGISLKMTGHCNKINVL